MKDTELSKYLSFVLRHKPESIGLTLDQEGWVPIYDLIQAAAMHGVIFTDIDLIRVVQNNEKKRFTLRRGDHKNKPMIRAAQGHSTNQVKMSMKAEVPPDELYHGTADRFTEVIFQEGLKPMSRHHVHLSAETETATKVGSRHGKVVILTVDAKAMLSDGYKFYKADNGVWLTDEVPPKYLK